jgi:hypothetical protein
MNQDLYDLFEEFMNGDFADNLVALRIREQVLALRLSIDTLEHLNRSRAGLTTYQREDLEDNWQDLDAMTRAYIYFSGDYELENIPDWNPEDFTPNEAARGDVGWEYWTQGDVK